MSKKIGSKVRLEGKHAPPRVRGEIGTLIQIEHHLQHPYSVRIPKENLSWFDAHSSCDYVINVKEDALNYANEDGEFERDKYEDLPWDEHMEVYLTEDEKQFLLEKQ